MLTAGSLGCGAAGCAGAREAGAGGALPKVGVEGSSGFCRHLPRLAPLKAPVVSEPFHKHLPWLSAQAECFWSVERGWVREAAVDFLPGSSVAQRSWRVTGHSAFTTRVLPMLLAQSKHWGVQMAEAPIPLLLGTN